MAGPTPPPPVRPTRTVQIPIADESGRREATGFVTTREEAARVMGDSRYTTISYGRETVVMYTPDYKAYTSQFVRQFARPAAHGDSGADRNRGPDHNLRIDDLGIAIIMNGRETPDSVLIGGVRSPAYSYFPDRVSLADRQRVNTFFESRGWVGINAPGGAVTYMPSDKVGQLLNNNNGVTVDLVRDDLPPSS